MMKHQAQSNLKLAQTNTAQQYQSMDIQYDEEHRLAWYLMGVQPRPCFTFELVKEIQHWFKGLERTSSKEDTSPIYTVMASKVDTVFNLGGDLNLFLRLIRNGDRDSLKAYAVACNDILYRNHIGHGKNITTISLVQGDALGGGFEAAVSSDVLIAERSAKMGLPDILFNLFPGAGAYSMLYRKIGMIEAERLVLSGKLYTAEQMHALGVVDILAEDGQGKQAVYNYVKKENRFQNGYRAFRDAKRCTNPLTFEELLNAAEIWVDAAFNLTSKDLRMMERLVKRQSARVR